MINAPGDGRTPATVELLAAHKNLDPAWLRSRFRLDNDTGGAIIPYPERRRLRKYVETSHPTIWLDDGKCSTYVDAATLGAARDCGELVICEGDSDRWTLEAHGIPALGVPGATMTKYITAENIAGQKRLHIIREPGKGGTIFVDGVVKRLFELRFSGETFAVDLHATCGVKDPSDLHVRDPQGFDAQWQRVIENSTPILCAWPELYPRPVLHPLALLGCAGDFVRLIAPQSEAAEAALLLQCLCVAGIAMGANAYIYIESTRHYAQLYVLLLGPTSRGRKGTAANHVKRLFRIANEDFVNEHFTGGLVSGEGMYRRCAPQGEQTPRSDRRLVFFEPEFGAKVLEGCNREGNTLSGNIRELYDSQIIEKLTSKDPLKARDVHAAIIAHCTIAEYRDKLSSVAIANGFANRFMVACVRRENILPFGGRNLTDSDFSEIGKKVNEAILFASEEYEVSWSEDARALYDRFYHLCAAEEGLYPELIAAMLGRLETHVLRTTLIYTLLDCKGEIGLEHLRAAIAVEAYVRSSVFYAFGPTLGNKTAGKILDALRDRGPMTRTEIRRSVFQDNLPADTVRKELDSLVKWGLVAAATEAATGGAPRDSFRPIGPGDERRTPYATDTLITLIT